MQPRNRFRVLPKTSEPPKCFEAYGTYEPSFGGLDLSWAPRWLLWNALWVKCHGGFELEGSISLANCDQTKRKKANVRNHKIPYLFINAMSTVLKMYISRARLKRCKLECWRLSCFVVSSRDAMLFVCNRTIQRFARSTSCLQFCDIPLVSSWKWHHNFQIANSTQRF
jgi:hypothetical protein